MTAVHKSPLRPAAPYAVARLHAMRTALIPAEDYARLLHQSEQELLAYLQSSAYRQDVDELHLSELDDLAIFDKVLARNANRDMTRLRGMCGGAFADALAFFLHRNDRWNVELAAFAIVGGHDMRETFHVHERIGTVPTARYTQAKSILELGEIASDIFPEIRRSKPQTLAGLRGALYDKQRVLQLPHLGRFLIDEENILRALTRKREGVTSTAIMDAIITGGTITATTWRAVVSAPDELQAANELATTQYGSALRAGPLELESRLHELVMERIHKAAIPFPTGPELLLRYLAQKEIEHHNIRLIVKARRLGLGDRFISEHLVV